MPDGIYRNRPGSRRATDAQGPDRFPGSYKTDSVRPERRRLNRLGELELKLDSCYLLSNINRIPNCARGLSTRLPFSGCVRLALISPPSFYDGFEFRISGAVFFILHRLWQSRMPGLTHMRRLSMKRLVGRLTPAGAIFFLQFILPLPVLATQGHGQPEGLYAHQMAHLFFIISMGVLIYWLRDRKLAAHPGWRFIQYSALFFILWNADAYTVHYLEEQLGLLEISRQGPWVLDIRAPEGFGWLARLYYAAKLDHLLCVPAMVFMYLGLKRFLHEGRAGGGEEQS
jgi:hypothetical protein